MNELMMEKITRKDTHGDKLEDGLEVGDLSEREAENVREIGEEIKKGNHARYDEISWD